MISARIQGRIDPELKKKAEIIIKKHGFTTSKLLTVIYSYIAKNKELPIEMKKVPNVTTQKAIKDSKLIGSFHTTDDLINDLNS